MQEDFVVLEVDPDWVEREIALSARHGDHKLRNIVKTKSDELKANRTQIERLLPGRPIGNNYAISQLSLILYKIGHSSDPAF